MHHKRKGPKSTRAGCLLCKPHKRQGLTREGAERHRYRKARMDARQQMAEHVEAARS